MSRTIPWLFWWFHPTFSLLIDEVCSGKQSHPRNAKDQIYLCCVKSTHLVINFSPLLSTNIYIRQRFKPTKPFTNYIYIYNKSYFVLSQTSSHQMCILVGYMGEGYPQPTILLSMDGPESHINSADRSLVAQLLDQKLMRNFKWIHIKNNIKRS